MGCDAIEEEPERSFLDPPWYSSKIFSVKGVSRFSIIIASAWYSQKGFEKRWGIVFFRIVWNWKVFLSSQLGLGHPMSVRLYSDNVTYNIPIFSVTKCFSQQGYISLRNAFHTFHQVVIFCHCRISAVPHRVFLLHSMSTPAFIHVSLHCPFWPYRMRFVKMHIQHRLKSDHNM